MEVTSSITRATIQRWPPSELGWNLAQLRRGEGGGREGVVSGRSRGGEVASEIPSQPTSELEVGFQPTVTQDMASSTLQFRPA